MKLPSALAAALFAFCLTASGADDPTAKINALLTAAARGDARAQYELGAAFYQQENYPAAAEWLQRSADQGNADAQCLLAVCYTYGQGVPKDDAKTIHWLTKAADQGSVNARFNLGLCYEKGISTKQDYRQAITWFSKISDYVETQYHLGLCYAALGDIPSAVDWLAKAAAQGNADAQAKLKELKERPAPRTGFVTQLAPIVTKPAAAAQPSAVVEPAAVAQPSAVVEPAAVAQPSAVVEPTAVTEPNAPATEPAAVVEPVAVTQPADTDADDEPEPQDPPPSPTSTVKQLLKAARRGNPVAQTLLGNRYAAGDEIHKNYDAAEYWYLKAAAQNYADAQYELGQLYRLHYTFVNNRVIRFLGQAAGQNHSGAQYELGNLYASGYGTVAQDWTKAAAWYARAAAQGRAEAQYELAVCYQQGRGLPRNLQQALAWYAKAADQGHVRAGEELAKYKKVTAPKPAAKPAPKTPVKYIPKPPANTSSKPARS